MCISNIHTSWCRHLSEHCWNQSIIGYSLTTVLSLCKRPQKSSAEFSPFNSTRSVGVQRGEDKRDVLKHGIFIYYMRMWKDSEKGTLYTLNFKSGISRYHLVVDRPSSDPPQWDIPEDITFLIVIYLSIFIREVYKKIPPIRVKF